MPAQATSIRRPLAILLFLGVTVVGVAVDLWTKTLALEHLAHGRVVRFLPGWVHFTYTTNEGAVFGLGQGQRWLFVTVSLAAIAFLAYLFMHSERRWLYQTMLGMLLAGVVGNMYDRLVYGHVRDMIHALPGWKWPQFLRQMLPDSWHWKHGDIFPWIFNVADSLLCIGVFLMIVYSMFRHAEEPEPETRMNTDARR